MLPTYEEWTGIDGDNALSITGPKLYPGSGWVGNEMKRCQPTRRVGEWALLAAAMNT